MSVHLTEEQAYAAMYAYLHKMYERIQSDDLGMLLGDMSLLSDGKTADPAVWSEWLECVHQAKRNDVDMNLYLQNLEQDLPPS